MITNTEYLSKREVMTILEQVRDNPAKLTRDHAMTRAIEDIDSLHAAPAFYPEHECEERIDKIVRHMERAKAPPAVAGIFYSLPGDRGRIALKITRITPTPAGLTIETE
jgi:hypothetical protein